MNWIAAAVFGGLELLKKVLFANDPPRTDRKPVDLNPKPKPDKDQK